MLNGINMLKFFFTHNTHSKLISLSFLYYSIMTATRSVSKSWKNNTPTGTLSPVPMPTQIFNTLPIQTTIRFKYAGGTSPNTLRDVSFHSFSWFGGQNAEPRAIWEGYLKAVDSSGCIKTYLYSKISYLQIIRPIASSPPFFNNLPNQTLIRFRYAGGTSPNTIRIVSFYSFNWGGGERNGQGEGYLKAHDSSNSLKTYHYSKISSLQIVQPEPEPQPEPQPQPQSKQTLLMKEMRAHIYSQNDIIEQLQDQLSSLNLTLTQHKTLYPSTWDGNSPKHIYGWEVINSPINN